ncbi:hypothetical protein BG261_10305 [Floricoccus tropicus]|uniref:DUF3923 domain-containing protein n=1 Tax=Floricoccus tropicus TaxID=1859473 RepID=A0A1E8GPA7_9LACT|nr:DUF3923 family protein [Floricoccus tropicus]OFI50027.1 hypothetical protein BG261_10305 [Floricoccus tropicus]
MKTWKVVSIIEVVLFVITVLFLWFRSVDGHGAVNNMENKLLSLFIITIFALILLAIQLVWFYQIKKR